MSAVVDDCERSVMAFDRDNEWTRDRRDEEASGPDLHTCPQQSVFCHPSVTSRCGQPIINHHCSIHGSHS